MKFKQFSAALVAGTLMTAVPAWAADSTHVRGTVESLQGSVLTVKTREGPSEDIKLKDGWKISGLAKATIQDIKSGDFVGITSLRKADGGNGALEVLIFPAALKGTGEGSFAWDLKPNSTMTNGTVADAVKAVDGRTLTVSYHGQSKKISVPEGTPVVTFAQAAKSDLAPGVAVFISADKAPDGSISAGRVVVGRDGVVPPM
jgi:hypothetical protein